jgi:transcriptional regulator with XRE-family HTH domain|tara:strand:- start:390 stop:605 length:216 start_codon:yes stop_codon:yes gene_type:complete
MTPEEFKQKRKSLGLTLAELGSMFGVHASTINKWENGNFPIKPMAIMAIENLHKSTCPTCKRPYIGKQLGF